jgi:RNA polymerase sigma-70 factor (ECF subfamily)
MMTNLPNPDLPHAFVRGDAGARNALLDAWLPLVLQWATRLGGPSVDPEDAAQDVFIVVLRKLEGLQDLNGFAPWVFGVTRRVVSQHRRRAWVRRWVPGASTERTSSRPGPEAATARAEIGRQVLEILELLPAAQREALVLCEMEERTIAEAAGLANVPVGTIKSRLRLGREAFRRHAATTDLGQLLVGGTP